MTDEKIVELVGLKCKAGAEALYDRYSQGLWLAIIRIAPDKAIAEAALAQTFLTIWRDISIYQPHAEKLFTFLIRIARQQALLIVNDSLQDQIK